MRLDAHTNRVNQRIARELLRRELTKNNMDQKTLERAGAKKESKTKGRLRWFRSRLGMRIEPELTHFNRQTKRGRTKTCL